MALWPVAAAAQADEANAPDLNEVVVTATRLGMSSFDVPAAISSVSGEQLRNDALGVNLADDVVDRAGPAGAQPEQLRPGPADLDPRYRRQLGVRHSRRARLPGRHPGDRARRPGPGVAVQSGLRGARRDSARARSRRCTATPRAASSRSSPRMARRPAKCAPPSPTAASTHFRAGLNAWAPRARSATTSTSRTSRSTATAITAARKASPSTARSTTAFNDSNQPGAHRQRRRRGPDAQDPLGLTPAQFAADPDQTDPAATQFNTRKSLQQQQGGLIYDLTDQRRAVRAGARLLRPPHRAAVPVDPGRRAERPDERRRRGRPEPQLRRRGCALVLAGELSRIAR